MAFDETFEESGPSGRKASRLDVDPFSSLSGMRRFPSENLDTITSLQRDNSELTDKLKELEVELAGTRALVTGAETKVRNLELERDRDNVEWDRERGMLVRDSQDLRDKYDTLQSKLKLYKQRETERIEESSRSRNISLDRSAELDTKVANLRADKEDLEEKLLQANIALARRPEVDKLKYNEEMQAFKTRISDLENQENVYNSGMTRLEEKKKETEELRLQNEKLQGQLRLEKLRGVRLEGELEANKDAVLQRICMRDKLEKYQELETENAGLRSRNNLLVETAENSALLREQVKQLEADRERLEGRVRALDDVRGQLEVEKKINREWSEAVCDWVTGENRKDPVTVVTARQIVRSWQQRELGYVEQLQSLKHSDQTLRAKLQTEVANKTQLEAAISRVKSGQEEQTKLVKKLQRKLLLVTRERDSYKSILDNYEKEMTITGDEFGQDRIVALEKNLEEYRAMVEMLENEKKDVAPMGTSSESQSQEIEKLKTNLKALEERNEKLLTELERRAIKGDFDPVETKVIHFSNNPFASAVDKRAREMSELELENTALKARIQLLEEGQTKDLTLMVGAKVEEGEGQKIKELNAEVEKFQKKEKRMMEVFSKTSQDFREAVFSLTGYRIDQLQDNRYRLRPQYAENQEDHFLFDKSEDGEICMLESEFSLEVEDLMDQHLEKNHSIPMFLAAVIMKLFDQQQQRRVVDVDDYKDGDDENDDEEEEEEDDENELEDEEEESGKASSNDNSSDSDEIIEIDDD